MAAERYFVKSGDTEKGPYTIDVLRSSLRDNALKRTTLIRAEDSDEWVRLDEVVKPEVPQAERAAAALRRDEAEGPSRAERAGKSNDALVGGIICLVGIIVTFASYSSAEGSGGRYVVAWGAILFGGIRMVRGLMG